MKSHPQTTLTARLSDLLRILEDLDDGDPLPAGGAALLATIQDLADAIHDRADQLEVAA